jgi:hypothetical protein
MSFMPQGHFKGVKCSVRLRMSELWGVDGSSFRLSREFLWPISGRIKSYTLRKGFSLHVLQIPRAQVHFAAGIESLASFTLLAS